jgi:hypothetical protein
MDAPSPISASPGWARALPGGPDARVKITEEYAKLVAKDAYFWAWPLVNISSSPTPHRCQVKRRATPRCWP